MEWFPLLVPPIVAVALWAKYPRKVVWWELLLPSLISFLTIFGLKLLVEYDLTADTEYWTGFATHSEFHEPWTEMRIETETYQEGGKTKTRLVTRYIHHPAEYWVIDSNGINVAVNRAVYAQLKERWQNSERRTPLRINASSNGDIFTSRWDNRRESMEIVTTPHVFENRVVASKTLLDYRDVSEEDVKRYGLFEFPRIEDYYSVSSMLGAPDGSQRAARSLDEYNALRGKAKEVRVWFLIFNNQDRSAGQLQEALWKNGKMNDFVVCLGTKEGKVSWAHVFSWTEAHGLKIQVRNAVEEQTELNLEKAVEDTKRLVETQWIRKDFSEFDYLSVPLPGWAIFLIWVTSLLSSGGASYWVVNNEFYDLK